MSLTTMADALDNKRLVLVTALIAVVIALPVGISVGMRWVDLPWDSTPKVAAPDWVALPTLRATTADGTAVKARVALDVQDGSAKSKIQRSTQQVGLLLETSVAARSQDELRSRAGKEALSRDMRARVNDYLGGDDDAVRAVMIQDLLVNPR